MSNDPDFPVLDEWPSEPPHPTDRHSLSPVQLPLIRCVHCGELIDKHNSPERSPYMAHLSDCDMRDQTIEVFTSNQFAVVVPEETGYVWLHQTNGFACSQVAIQGTLIPIGSVVEHHIGHHVERDDSLDGKFDAFDNPDDAKRIYLMGLSSSTDYEYGGIDLGQMLVNETLDGVYTDDDEERQRKAETRDDRIAAVWDRIDSVLPFTYDQVAAPRGYPVTQEGLRWVVVTGHQHDDDILRDAWVDALIDRDEPVALYYPNSD